MKIKIWNVLALGLLSLLFGGELAAQDLPFIKELFPPSESHKPRDNSEFIGVKTIAPATQQFEMYNPHTIEQLQSLKEMGFTQVILDWPHMHVEASKLGFDVVLANWWTKDTPQEDIDKAFELARQVDPDHLVGISTMDEPERNSKETPFSYYVDVYKQLRSRIDRELPGVRVEVSHWGPHATWDERHYQHFAELYRSCDVMRIMPFPDLREKPLSDVYFMMLRSREVMKLNNRELPLLVILQTWVRKRDPKLPEIPELRVMAWQAMLGGAETISFFNYDLEVWGQFPGFESGFAEMMHELTQASARFKDATIESSMAEDGVLEATIRWPNGDRKTLLVNTNREAARDLKPLEIVERDAPEEATDATK